MSKQKRFYGIRPPSLTRGKILRLVFFVLLNLLAFCLTHWVPQVRTFAWGYAFGLVGMAILTG
ncbi:MAG: hypothetical protein NC911_03455 [Candidatus Omnitrophica bacterium]|nr:hypothetical protein [Candidatus Omnitrophota bacterium]MCM8768724.1 hypothetical protein [Candidatus Omnitrophota bacterium]